MKIRNQQTGNMIEFDGAQFKKLLKIQNTMGTEYFSKTSLAACDSKNSKASVVKCSTNPKGTPPCKEKFHEKTNKKGEMCCYKNAKKYNSSSKKSVPKSVTPKSVPNNVHNDDLHDGISASDYELVQEAISNGANVNHVDENSKETPLFESLTSTLEIMDLLIQNGANVNAKNRHCDTVLHKACEYENEKAITYLLGKKADVNAVNDQGKTPLLVVLYAYISNEDKLRNIVKQLIQKGANINVKDNEEHNTPLHLACDLSDIEIVKLFIKKGANMTKKNKNNETPLDIAKKRGYKKIATFLSSKMKA
jgi:ankyrin repeat protein